MHKAVILKYTAFWQNRE